MYTSLTEELFVTEKFANNLNFPNSRLINYEYHAGIKDTEGTFC